MLDKNHKNVIGNCIKFFTTQELAYLKKSIFFSDIH